MKFRRAWSEDLPQLKIMFDKIVANMRRNGLNFWNETYPYEEFANDIKRGHLYLVVDEDVIVATLCFDNDIEEPGSLEWEAPNARAVYLNRVGINVNYLNKNVGVLILKYTKLYAMDSGKDYMRLVTAKENAAAINFCKENGFVEVPGERTFSSDTLGQAVVEIGLEYKI